MRKGALLRFFVVIFAIIGIFACTVGWLAGHIRQGLDLQGGTHIVMQAEDTDQNKVTPEAITQVINIMQKRVNEMGLTEPITSVKAATVSSLNFRARKIRRRPLIRSARQPSCSSRMKREMSA